MTVHVWKSTDTGAPTLSGTAGDLITLLDALLVNGYNSKTVTITRSGNTATVSSTSHGLNANQTIVISGANEAEYNVTTRVTIINANSYSYPVDNNPTTPATGTITAKVAPAGWAKSYSGTNKAAYRQKAGTNQFYLRVDDNGTGSASYARVVGYETMSDVDTGTNAFPTNVQQSGGLYATKSNAASATTRTWRAYSNGKLIHLLVKGDGTYWARILAFGDCKSFKAGDAFCTLMRASEYTSFGSNDGSHASFGWTSSSGAQAGVFLARSYSQTGTSITASSCSVMRSSQQAINAGNYASAYPAPIAGGMILVPLMLREGTANVGIRATEPGSWDSAHDFTSVTFTDGDTWSGAVGSELAGRTFEVTKTFYNNSVMIFETSDTWDA